MNVMVKIFLLQLAILMTTGDQGHGVYKKTIIGVELIPNVNSGVFLVGGFTGGDESRCAGNVSQNPCSIPSHHIFPEDAPISYMEWASGDNYLDLVGAEPDQGKYEGKDAIGTPMWTVDLETAQDMLHFVNPHPSREYWIVELELDCSKTDGLFEVEVVLETKSSMYIYELKDEIIRPGQPPIKIKPTKPPKVRVFSLDDHDSQNDLTGHSHKSDKPGSAPKQEGVEVTPVRGNSTSKMGRGCMGSAHFKFPYTTSRHLGLCGKANLFRFKSGMCEINKL